MTFAYLRPGVARNFVPAYSVAPAAKSTRQGRRATMAACRGPRSGNVASLMNAVGSLVSSVTPRPPRARATLARFVAGLALAGCGSLGAACAAGTQGAPPATVAAAPPAPPSPIAPPPLVPGQPLVELRAPGAAVVNGLPIAFDGVEEALVWPALDRAIPDETYAGEVVLRIDRAEPTKDVLRAVFTLREADLRLEGTDKAGAARFVSLRKKPHHAGDADGARCHLAVFVRQDGSLRVAAPGGPRELDAPRATERLVDALQATEQDCPISYVAFGALDASVTFGSIFDVILAVDAASAAGNARYVLAEPVAPPAAR